jgi:hypothetical protein
MGLRGVEPRTSRLSGQKCASGGRALRWVTTTYTIRASASVHQNPLGLSLPLTLRPKTTAPVPKPMSSIRVVASLVNDDEQDFAFGDDFLRKLAALEARGLKGKALINDLITDDWAAPPNFITITGSHPDGRRINRVISYD